MAANSAGATRVMRAMSSKRRRIKLRPNGTEVPQFVSRASTSNGRKEPLRWVDLKKSHSRLQELYAIGKLITRFGNVETTVRAVAGIVRQTLALRSAIFIRDTGRSRRVLIWHARAAWRFRRCRTRSPTLERRTVT